MSSRSIVKDSEKLRNALKQRWKELGISQVDVERDAVLHGQPRIIRNAVNKYLHKAYAKGGLNEQGIIWLAWRWGIPVTLAVGVPNTKGVTYDIPPYNEERALEMLYKVFPPASADADVPADVKKKAIKKKASTKKKATKKVKNQEPTTNG